MTANTTIKGIVSYINGLTPEQAPNLSGIPAYTSTEDEEREFPSITVTDTGSDEHDVLDGVLDPLSVDVKLWTIPNADGDGTTQDQHEAISTEIYDQLAGERLIEYLDDEAKIKVFDIHGIGQANEREDGYNVMTLSMDIVCCKQYQILDS